MEGLKNCKDDDIILISDLDEIPNPDVIRKYHGDSIFMLHQDLYWYFLNYKNILPNYWYGTRILTYKNFFDNTLDKYVYSYGDTLIQSLNQGNTPTKVRIIKDFPVIKNGGWHFSYLGGLERIKYKINSFAHQEFNNDQYLNDKQIDFKIKNGIDLFRPKDYRYIPVKIDYRHLPENIINKYPHLLYSDIHLFRNLIVIITTYCYYYLFRLPLKHLKIIVKKIIGYKK